MGNNIVIRFQPLVAPILHEINIYTHYFFVPNRLLWDDWEKFITKGTDGSFVGTIPTWPVEINDLNVGTLYDYFGYPMEQGILMDSASHPNDFLRRAYAFIYNEYYLDQNLETPLDFKNFSPTEGKEILLRSWEKDYFSAALPFQQRGVAPGFPVTGTAPVTLGPDTVAGSDIWTLGTQVPAFDFIGQGPNTAGSPPAAGTTMGIKGSRAGAVSPGTISYNAMSADLSSSVTFNVSDLRLAVQIQRWLERNARAGVRYTEFLKSHFGVSPYDARLDRPEYVGGTRNPAIISEVLQTSESTTNSQQGNLAGHGLTVGSNFAGKYSVQEHGWIMAIMSIMPKPAYTQGIERMHTRRTTFDYYFPEFAHLSEQAVLNRELYIGPVPQDNEAPFGFQGKYDELRHRRSKSLAEFRGNGRLKYWHLSREFASPPQLSAGFLKVDNAQLKRIFAVQNEPGFICNIGHSIRAIRPMPAYGFPGYLDH